ncbi:MAG: hypothetical protein K2N44_18455 [Lachnospiraceae bacterium]|nr:hypothetical protein [Lachnospiraceae bacterium]
MTVHDNVTVTGAFGIGRLTGFEAHIIPNAHASAVISGIADDIADLARWQMSEMEQEVTVSLESGRILFCGLVESAVWEQEAEEVYRVELQLISGSTALDREKESRSFQDTGMSYAKIVEKAVASTPGHTASVPPGVEKSPCALSYSMQKQTGSLQRDLPAWRAQWFIRKHAVMGHICGWGCLTAVRHQPALTLVNIRMGSVMLFTSLAARRRATAERVLSITGLNAAKITGSAQIHNMPEAYGKCWRNM